jgi:Histone chaperone Rttp106-like
MSSLPPAKRQKIQSAVDVFDKSTPNDPSTLLTIRDLSFQTPLRKKLNLIFTQTDLQAHSPAKEELSVPISQIRHVICVAAPDKAAKTWNFVIIYSENDDDEALAFGVPDTVGKTAVGSQSFKFDSGESYKSILISAFKQSKINVVEPSASEFASPIPLPGRPKEAAYHAVSHRGAKEGFLYFLATGILYGFKKPILFFPLNTIREVTFTNILQRTFNLVVSTEEDVEGEEFGMIDQALFAGIQGYAEKHGIQDASLSEERKAKRAGRQTQEDTEGGELEKAAKDYDAGHKGGNDFRDFDKEEAEWEDGEIPKAKGKAKKKEGTTRDLIARVEDGINGAGDIDSSDDEDFDATFEGAGSDGGSPGSGSSDEDSDSSDESSDDDDDSDDDENDESEGDEEDEEEDE